MSQKKMLCIDLRWIDSSGVGVYIQGIMPGLAERLNDTDIIGIGDRDRLEQFPWSAASNFRIVHSLAPRYSMREQVELPRLIPSECNLFFSPYYTIPLFYRGPLAVTVHDMSHLVVEEIVSNPRKRIYAQIMYRALTRKASLIFTVSHFTKTELMRLAGVPAQKIFPILLGISQDWYEAQRQPPVRQRPYFVVVGNIKPYKNLPRLLEAFLAIRDQVPYDLVIVGQGEGLITGESEAFFQRARSAGDRVVFTGKVSYNKLLSLVGHAGALVMPSLYEGFGLPPAEAMAAGVPVAVARAGSLPEVCGEGALYFDPLDPASIATALESIATDADLRARLREAGRKQSLAYRWDTAAEETAAGLRVELWKTRGAEDF